MSNFKTMTTAVSRVEYAAWLVGVVVVGLFVIPGGGAVIGLVLAQTRLKHSSVVVRWSPLAVGVALVVTQVVGLASGWSSTSVSPSSPA